MTEREREKKKLVAGFIVDHESSHKLKDLQYCTNSNPIHATSVGGIFQFWL